MPAKSVRHSYAIRYGGVYIAVLMTSLLVCALAMTAVCTSHAEAKRQYRSRNLFQLKLDAHNALNIALAQINSASDWRTRFPHQSSVSLPAVSQATIQFYLNDSDGQIGDDVRDPVDIIASSQLNDASYRLRVALVPDGEPFPSLEHCLAAEASINVQSGGSWNCNPSIAAGQNIDCTGTSVCSNCYSPSVTGNIHGPQHALAQPIVMPNERFIEHFERLGTSLSLAPILGVKLVWGAALSPRVNTLGGPTNPLGIYILDCEGHGLTIASSRIQGTLVIKNCGGTVTIGPQLHWEPASLNLPAFVIDSNVQLQIGSTPVLELGQSFNPPDFPYHNEGDYDLADQFPAHLRGAMVVFGNCDFGSSLYSSRMSGSIFARSFSGNADIECTGEPRLTSEPPLGMRSFDRVRVAPFSLRRISSAAP